LLDAPTDTELLEAGVSASALPNVLDELVASPSTPAAPPHAVKIIEKIRPQKGSLALFSAKESIFSIPLDIWNFGCVFNRMPCSLLDDF